MGTATKGLGAITLMLAALAACGAEQRVTEFPAPPSTSTTRLPALSAGEFTAAFEAICSRPGSGPSHPHRSSHRWL